mmetsp:Transcript_10862/g.31590  ORF Transcript_10862/g.31590 Transcript_10862/m.31590 type:complete len:236 (-) Transcript_10862:97-804(-)
MCNRNQESPSVRFAVLCFARSSTCNEGDESIRSIRGSREKRDWYERDLSACLGRNANRHEHYAAADGLQEKGRKEAQKEKQRQWKRKRRWLWRQEQCRRIQGSSCRQPHPGRQGFPRNTMGYLCVDHGPGNSAPRRSRGRRLRALSGSRCLRAVRWIGFRLGFRLGFQLELRQRQDGNRLVPDWQGLHVGGHPALRLLVAAKGTDPVDGRPHAPRAPRQGQGGSPGPRTRVYRAG